MGYKTPPIKPRLKIKEQTVQFKKIIQTNSPPKLKNPILQKQTETIQSKTKPSSETIKTPTQPIQKKIENTTPSKVKPSSQTMKPPARPTQKKIENISTEVKTTSRNAALKNLAQQLLRDSDNLLKSLETTDKVCSAIQRHTMHVDITHDSKETDENFVTEFVKIIQNSLSLPNPGNVRIRLEIFPLENQTRCSIENSDNESNKNYVLNEMSRISFKEIIKKYNFQKKIVFQIKLIGNPK